MRKAIIHTNGNGNGHKATIRDVDLAVRIAETEQAAEGFQALRDAIQERRETVLRELATLNGVLGYAPTDCRTSG